MTGEEHYREAERLTDANGPERWITRAQVHATLALVAVTADIAGGMIDFPGKAFGRSTEGGHSAR